MAPTRSHREGDQAHRVTLRPARIEDCDALGLITVSASHSAFIGAVPEKLLDFSWTPEASAANWRKGFAGFVDRGQLFYVLEREGEVKGEVEGEVKREDESEVIGFVWACPWADTPGYDACVHGLYVLPSCHGQGFGKRLVHHAAERLHAAGAASLEIGCVRENPSCGFYRHLGGKEVGRRPVKVDAFETVEILFGWPDLTTLIQPPA